MWRVRDAQGPAKRGPAQGGGCLHSRWRSFRHGHLGGRLGPRIFPGYRFGRFAPKWSRSLIQSE